MNKKVMLLILILLSFVLNMFPREGKQALVPEKLPEGFGFARTPEFFGTSEKPLANGNIYDFMNGGGIVYEEHGYRELTHVFLKNKKDNGKTTITLNIFNMGTGENAAAALADTAICPEGFTIKDIGAKAKTYRFQPDFYLYFTKGKYLVYLAVNDDTLAETLMRFAAEIYINIG